MALVEQLFGDGGRSVDYVLIPTAVFTHPSIGTIGCSEAHARERFGAVRVYRSEFRPLRHTLSGSSERTLMKLVVDDATDRVVGLHMVGAEAGEIVQGFAVAMTAGATKAMFDATIGIHPTAAEEFVTMRSRCRHDAGRESAAAALARRRTACRRSHRSAPSTSLPAFETAMRRASRRGRGDRRRPRSRRRSTTRSRPSTAPAAAARASSCCSTTSRRARPRRRCRRWSARWRRGSPRTTARSTCTPRCSRASTRCTRAAPSSASTREQLRVLERFHARLRARRRTPRRRRRSSAMPRSWQRLAELTTRFGQNVLADEAACAAACCATSAISPACPTSCAPRRARPRRARHRRTAVITLSRSLIVPFLTFSERRDLREQAWRAWTTRGEHAGAHDNRPVAREILALRHEQARLHGYASYADYALRRHDGAARRRAVTELLEQVWAPAKRARRRRARGARGARALARRERARSSPGTGATTPRRCARCATTSTRRRSSRTSRSTRMVEAAFDCAGAPVRLSLRRRVPTSRLPPRRRASTRCTAPTVRWSACSCTTTSRGRPSAAAPG